MYLIYEFHWPKHNVISFFLNYSFFLLVSLYVHVEHDFKRWQRRWEKKHIKFLLNCCVFEYKYVMHFCIFKYIYITLLSIWKKFFTLKLRIKNARDTYLHMDYWLHERNIQYYSLKLKKLGACMKIYYYTLNKNL